MSSTDTNQASEELESKVTEIVAMIPMFTDAKLTEIGWEKYGENEKDAIAKLLELIRTEKLKLLDEVMHQSTVNLKSSKAVAGWAEIRKKQMEAEL